MKKEAVRRMIRLGILKKAIKDFSTKGKIYISMSPEFMPLYDRISSEIENFQKSTKDLVYHAIVTSTAFGLQISVLFVSEDKTQWELERRDINHSSAFAYVINLDEPDCSEYGTIGMKAVNGTLKRIF